ncbi:secretory pathway protein Sec39-domain-containing protein [Mycena floridula]|nr:secretory pathway protein Sec39-domain-containing protein [Mycena floridula]
MDSCERWIGLSDGELDVAIVQDIFKNVSDDIWVVSACLDRLLDNVAVQRALLEVGLSRTEKVVERCQDAIAQNESIPEQEALVSHFQHSSDDAQLCHARSVLLERLDRLNIFTELCHVEPKVDDDGDAWEDDAWDNEPQDEPSPAPIPLPRFLTDEILHISCLFALQQQFSALQMIQERCEAQFWPYRFTILNSIPRHVHPSNFQHLLPAVENDIEQRWISKPWRETVDFSETNAVRAAVAALEIIPPRPSPQTRPQSAPLSSVELSDWYQRLVNDIISSTGMVDIALGIVQHGAARGVAGLDELGEELSLFSRLVYDTNQDEDEDQDDTWSLETWRSMDPPAIVRAYLSHSTPESISQDISRLVMPYLLVLELRAERAGTPDPSIASRLLYDYILECNLPLVAAIFEASKPTLPHAKRLIKNDEDLARLALACLYGSDSRDEWQTMSSIFECLPAWNAQVDDGTGDSLDATISRLGAFVTPSTSGSHPTPKSLLEFFQPLSLSSLSHALDILDVHLESSEILSRWHVAAPLRWFLQSRDNAAEQRAWANRMARRAGGSEEQLLVVSDWEWLLEDMIKLSGGGDGGLRGAFGLLSREEVVQIFFAGMLSTGKFDIAKSLLRSSKHLTFTPSTLEDLCLSCSREFYDNAESGNYKFGDMKSAYDCLSVPRPSERLEREKEFIEATSRLCSFNIVSRPGVTISPIEIRLTKDRLSLISRVLSSNSDAYKHAEVILDLVYKLGLRDDVVAEVKTLAMLADTALQSEDFEKAYESSQRMVNTVLNLRVSEGAEDPKLIEASEVCWVACFQLGRQSEFTAVEQKLSLLGRALELCPPDKLHDVLTAWRHLEKEDIAARQERKLPSQGLSGSRKRRHVEPTGAAAAIRARLQDFHMPSPPILSTPDAAALASRTFKSVAANFPFSVPNRPSQSQRPGGELEDVSVQATRAFSRGIGWLIGADDT